MSRLIPGIIVALIGCALPIGLIELVGQTGNAGFWGLIPVALLGGIGLFAAGVRIVR
jgi:hypothetical protein